MPDPDPLTPVLPDPGPLGPGQLADLLDASRAAIVAELAALGRHSTDHLIADEWCANEVVGHLIEAERRGFAGRIRAMVAEDRPRLQTWVPRAVAVARRDDERDPGALIAELDALRAESLVLIRSLTPAMLARAGVHPQVGEVTVEQVAHEWVHHDRKHLAQLVALTRRLVWTSMGNAQFFYQPAE